MGRLPKWPFWLADVFLVLAGVGLAFAFGQPLTIAAMGIVAGSVALGAVVAVLPYVLEHLKPAATPAEPTEEAAKLWQQVQRLEFRVAELEAKGQVAKPNLAQGFAAARSRREQGELDESPPPTLVAQPRQCEATPPVVVEDQGELAPAGVPPDAALTADKATETDPSNEAEPTPTLLQQRLGQRSSVQELLAKAEASRGEKPAPAPTASNESKERSSLPKESEGNLPTSLDEVDLPPAKPSGMMQRAMRKPGGVLPGRKGGVNKLIQGKR